MTPTEARTQHGWAIFCERIRGKTVERVDFAEPLHRVSLIMKDGSTFTVKSADPLCLRDFFSGAVIAQDVFVRSLSCTAVQSVFVYNRLQNSIDIRNGSPNTWVCIHAHDAESSLTGEYLPPEPKTERERAEQELAAAHVRLADAKAEYEAASKAEYEATEMMIDAHGRKMLAQRPFWDARTAEEEARKRLEGLK